MYKSLGYVAASLHVSSLQPWESLATTNVTRTGKKLFYAERMPLRFGMTFEDPREACSQKSPRHQSWQSEIYQVSYGFSKISYHAKKSANHQQTYVRDEVDSGNAPCKHSQCWVKLFEGPPGLLASALATDSVRTHGNYNLWSQGYILFTFGGVPEPVGGPMLQLS